MSFLLLFLRMFALFAFYRPVSCLCSHPSWWDAYSEILTVSISPLPCLQHLADLRHHPHERRQQVPHRSRKLIQKRSPHLLLGRLHPHSQYFLGFWIIVLSRFQFFAKGSPVQPKKTRQASSVKLRSPAGASSTGLGRRLEGTRFNS